MLGSEKNDPMISRIKWPEGKKFCFTVFDDTDEGTTENVREAYSLLKDLGFRTTKSVWPLGGGTHVPNGGATCEDPEYFEWALELQWAGFEIGYHMSTFHSATRDEIKRGIERFSELFGHYPLTMANHEFCEENIYWGENRLSGVNSLLYSILTRFRERGLYKGHKKGSLYFWGDICKEKVKYVRNFVFASANTLKECPMMPYFDPARPYVSFWFASSGGATVHHFNQIICEKNQDQLEEEGGACIMYIHFASGFYRDGRLDSRFKYLMKRLAQKKGWFVPVSTLLDFLLSAKGIHILTDRERRQLERRWLWHKIRSRMAYLYGL